MDGEAESEPLGVVVVTPPWNFPYAIPAGGVLAALAAGNAVVLKPAPEARATAAVLVGQLREAGIDENVLQFLPLDDGPAGRALVTHPDVGGVVLTGSYETARSFLTWAPRRRLLAETSGKNSIIVSATADVDQAVRDVVTLGVRPCRPEMLSGEPGHRGSSRVRQEPVPAPAGRRGQEPPDRPCG